MTQPQITVGILSGKEIEFSFPVKFIGKGKSTTNYPSFLHKMRMLSLN